MLGGFQNSKKDIITTTTPNEYNYDVFVIFKLFQIQLLVSNNCDRQS